MDEYLEAVESDKKLKSIMLGRESKPAVQYDMANYKLNELVGTKGIRYWGQFKSSVNGGQASAMFICPVCNETWRTSMYKVVNDIIRHCGCEYGKANKGKKEK